MRVHESLQSPDLVGQYDTVRVRGSSTATLVPGGVSQL